MSDYTPAPRPDGLGDARTIEEHLAEIEALIRDNVDEEYVDEDRLVAAVVAEINAITRLVGKA
jgi:hypothetical protein